MGQTIGYHLVKSGFGLWLPGDERGHWSEAWDAQLGYIEPHTLHPGDVIMTGTPEGVGPVIEGDTIKAHCQGIGDMTVPVKAVASAA